MDTQQPQPQPSFDSDLQMFRETDVAPRSSVLRFYRWLAERGCLEHEVFGPPAGEWALDWNYTPISSEAFSD